MSGWHAVIEYDTSDPVHAPTALLRAVDGLDFQHADGQTPHLRLSFPVTAPTLRSASETALRTARAALRAADMEVRARSIRVEPDTTPTAAAARRATREW